jgi:hypothetical protein
VPVDVVGRAYPSLVMLQTATMELGSRFIAIGIALFVGMPPLGDGYLF